MPFAPILADGDPSIAASPAGGISSPSPGIGSSSTRLRFIDASGQEIVRVDRKGGTVALVPPDQLQNKADRDYTIETMKLDRGQTFVSDNRSQCRARRRSSSRPSPRSASESRCSTAPAPSAGSSSSTILRQRILDRVNELRERRRRHLGREFRRATGLLGPPDDAFAFMYPDRKDRTFAAAHPDVWRQMQAAPRRAGRERVRPLRLCARRVSMQSAAMPVRSSPAGSSWSRRRAHFPTRRPAFSGSTLRSRPAGCLVAARPAFRSGLPGIRSTACRRAAGPAERSAPPRGHGNRERCHHLRRPPWQRSATSTRAPNRPSAIGAGHRRPAPDRAHAGAVPASPIPKACNAISTRRDAKVIGQTVELVGLRKDGTEFPIDLALASSEVDGDLFFTAIVRDITKRRTEARARDPGPQSTAPAGQRRAGGRQQGARGVQLLGLARPARAAARHRRLQPGAARGCRAAAEARASFASRPRAPGGAADGPADRRPAQAGARDPRRREHRRRRPAAPWRGRSRPACRIRRRSVRPSS